MKLVRSLTYFIAAFILCTGGLLAFGHQIGLFEVNRIPVEVTSAGDEATLRADSLNGVGLKRRLESSLKKFKGKRIWEIDLAQMRASIVRDEWVKDALISRRLPNEILVEIKAKKPALVILSKKGEFLPITEEGEMLSALSPGVLPDVPLLRGEAFFKNRELLMSTIEYTAGLAEKGPLSRKNISEISWSQEEGYTLTLIQPKIEVKLGEDRIDTKTLRVAQVLGYLSATDLKGRVIDASFSKKVLVRLRKGS